MCISESATHEVLLLILVNNCAAKAHMLCSAAKSETQTYFVI